MKIHWAQNPLQTTVELDDHDKEILRLKANVEVLEEHLSEASFHLDEGKWFDLAKAHAAIDLHYDKEAVQESITQRVGWYIPELERGIHCGDCTCVPASCSKCHAESVLGIDTIKGVGKHALTKIEGCFLKPQIEKGKWAGYDLDVTIHDAIRKLENYEPKADWAGWEVHAPRWKAEASRALEWLRAYRDEHFPITAESSP